VLIWAKNNFSIGRKDYHWMHEPMLYGWPLGTTHRWFGDRSQTSVWALAKDPVNGYVHPTQKPVELAERAIGNSSEAGQFVLDVFGGSGSTLIACERLGRRAGLLELDPHYVDVIIIRWQEFTGGKATLDGDGRTFAQLAAERVPAQTPAADLVSVE
jgi:DNA modification methylase